MSCCLKKNLNAPRPSELLLLLMMIHTFSVLSLQLKKLRRHNNSDIDLSNVNPACGHKEVRRSTGHIMETTRSSDQQGSKSRQKVMRLYKQWHRPVIMSKRFIKPPYSISRAPSIDSDCCRLPTNQRSQQQSGQITLQPVLINKSKFLKVTHCTKIREIKISRSMVRGGGLELVKPAREPAAFSRPKSCAFLKKPHESCPFATPRDKFYWVQLVLQGG